MWLSPLLRTEIVLGSRPGVRYFLASLFLHVCQLFLEQNTDTRYKDPQTKEMNDYSLTKILTPYCSNNKVAVTSTSNPRILQTAD